jgi:uncharacterized cupin superfamily protein
MMPNITNIFEGGEWKEEKNPRGEIWKHLDLESERLGVRLEELAPGESSSYHHFHTSEEEHVIALEGSATLILDSGNVPLTRGDHICFVAGSEEAHHIENTSSEPFRFLVFGERNPDDVVVYPEHQVMLLKGLGFRQFTYRPLKARDKY